MNLASWIILLVVVVWIGFAVKSAFFGGGKKGSCHGSCGGDSHAKGQRAIAAASDDDEKYRLPNACTGCSKGSCSSCPSAGGRNVPMPAIREL